MNNYLADPIEQLFNLVNYHILIKHEIYTLAQLTRFYEELSGNDRSHPKFRSIDLNGRLQENFQNKLKFIRPTQSNSSNISEYVMSYSENLLADCITTAELGGGIKMSIDVKYMSTSFCAEIQERNERTNRKWSHTPQGVMRAKIFDESNSLYDLLAWSVEPYASCDEKGIVKLSVTKATKVSKICADIESLVPHGHPALSQDLLSLNMYHKTGSSVVIEDLHKLGHGLSYTETKFVEDKWVEWAEKESHLTLTKILS